MVCPPAETARRLHSLMTLNAEWGRNYEFFRWILIYKLDG